MSAGRNITLELLQSYYHVPLVEVAQDLGISLTMLKKVCRKFGIQRWPHRQIRSINNTMKEMVDKIHTAETAGEAETAQRQIELLDKKKRLVCKGASSGLQAALRNALFMANPDSIREDELFDENGDVLSKLQRPATPAPAAPAPPAPVAPRSKMSALRRAVQDAQAIAPSAPLAEQPSLPMYQPKLEPLDTYTSSNTSLFTPSHYVPTPTLLEAFPAPMPAAGYTSEEDFDMAIDLAIGDMTVDDMAMLEEEDLGFDFGGEQQGAWPQTQQVQVPQLLPQSYHTGFAPMGTPMQYGAAMGMGMGMGMEQVGYNFHNGGMEAHNYMGRQGQYHQQQHVQQFYTGQLTEAHQLALLRDLMNENAY